MYSLDEVNAALDNDSVSDAIYKIQRFAESQGLTELSRWCHLELDGYKDSTDDERTAVKYRSPAVEWVTVYNTPIQVGEEFAFLSKLPLWTAAPKLEEFKDKGAIYNPPGLLDRLSQLVPVPIKGARLTPEVVQGLLNGIRKEARKRLHDSVPRVPTRKLSYPAPNFGVLVTDTDLVRILGQRWIEANLCFEAGAYLATVIMLGSILEGTLLAKAQQNPADANRAVASPKDRSTGATLPFRQWTLQDLINVSHECGWLKRQNKDFSHVVREYRNFVHPNEERQQGITIDVNTCRIIWEVVTAALI